MSRKLSALEQKIHQAALAAPNASLSQKEIDALARDGQTRTAALNFLLGAGMFKAMNDTKGRMVYRAVVKKELEADKSMSGEESMVLSHIQASGNDGIWTKHIKAKTELHQTVLDRCLKSLVQKQRIKAVKSVKFPTRKIYMLFHLDPSVEMTGGPWYTDNELDTEFIKLLSRACLQFIKDRSFPRSRRKTDETRPTVQQFYSISAAPAYPSSQQVQGFLSKSNITETELTVEHVEILLNVLVLDGEVERIPAFGAALWSSNQGGDEDVDERKQKKKKGRKDSERKRKRLSDSDSDMAVDDEDDFDVEGSKKSKSKSKKYRASNQSDVSDGEDERKRSKKRSKSRRKDDSSSDEDSDDGSLKTRRSKSKKKRAKATPSDSDSSDTLDSGSNEFSRHRRIKSRSSQRSASPDAVATLRDVDGLGEAFGGAAYVYRALRPEREGTAIPSTFMSWSSQTPCARCPVFDFCKQGAPVNPTECVYYGDWLGRGVAQVE